MSVIASELGIKDFQIYLHAKQKLRPSKKPYQYTHPAKLVITATGEEVDNLCKEALRYWLTEQYGKASIASAQRNLGIGFNRAGRIMNKLQQLGYVTKNTGSAPNTVPLLVLVEPDDLDKLFTEISD